MRSSQLSLSLLLLLMTPLAGFGQGQSTEQFRQTLTVDGVEREYYVRLPRDYDSTREYWLLVIAHNPVRNGMDYWLPRGVRRYADDTGLQAIVVSPSFRPVWGRYPTLGEGDYLKQVIEELQARHRLREKILLAGYSFGGQVAHRFTFQNPDLVAASAPLAAGSWTTPDGVLTSYTEGVVDDPAAFFASSENGVRVPDQVQKAARAATLSAHPDSREIPFLVMVGTQDPRLEHTQALVSRLRAAGYEVEKEWPDTPHSCLRRDQESDRLVTDAACDAEFGAEFDRYTRRVVDFFLRVTRR